MIPNDGITSSRGKSAGDVMFVLDVCTVTVHTHFLLNGAPTGTIFIKSFVGTRSYV